MSYLNVHLLPPQNWQDFEIMMKGIAEVIWDDHGWHHYGRGGQEQSGIDLYGYDRNSRCIGIQCKRKTITDPNGKLLDYSLLEEKEIEAEVNSAKAINDPRLDELIFATTASSDTKIQNAVRKIDKKVRKQHFKVDVWFWEDIAAQIKRHDVLLNWFYKDILRNIELYDHDLHILLTLRNAFKRPAFRCDIRQEESGGDFLQAIKDTQELISTGKHYNRRRGLIATVDPADQLSKPEWRKAITDIDANLDKIRTLYIQGTRDGSIIAHPSWLEFNNDKLALQLDYLRSKCLKVLNGVLADKGADLISCNLVNDHDQIQAWAKEQAII